MKITFQSIKIENFLSIGKAEYKFDNSGFILVSGKNENIVDNAVSNGSGKSSLFDAIIWALTGDTVRGTKDVVNMFSVGGTLVELNFTVDSINYKIIRSKDHSKYKTNLKLYENDVDLSGKGIRDTSKILENTLPDLTSSLIGSVIILGQGLPQRFTSNTPAGRKELLEKLSKSDFMIEDLKARVAKRKSMLFAILNNKKVSKEVNEKLIKEYEANLSKLNADAANISKSDIIDGLNSEIADISNTINSLVDNQEEYNNEFNKLNAEFLSISENYSNITSDYTSKKSAEEKEFNNYVIEYNNKKSKFQFEINRLSNKISEINNMSDVCPTCGQKLVNFIRPDTTELIDELQATREYLEDLSDEYTLRYVEHTDKVQQLKVEYDTSIVDTKEKMNSLKGSLDNINSNIKSAANDINVNTNLLASKKAELSRITDLKSHIESDIKDCETKIAEIKDDLLYIIDEVEDTTARLDVISNMETLLKRDFRGILLTDVIDYIRARCKEYCSIIFNTDLINFELSGNDIDISYNGKLYENLSGGEKQKIDLIVQFAIRDMLSKQLNFSSNILVLDEIFDNLDSVGCEKVLELISKELSDVENLFIITHHASIAVPYDKEIIVVKGADNVSTINVI